MQISFKKIVVLTGLLVVLFMFIASINDMNKRKNSINENKFQTVGKVYKFHSNRSFNHYYFTYNYKGREYNNYQNIGSHGRENCVIKFYRLCLSTKNPEYSEVFLDQEVTDSAEIVSAGFKYESPKKE